VLTPRQGTISGNESRRRPQSPRVAATGIRSPCTCSPARTAQSLARLLPRHGHEPGLIGGEGRDILGFRVNLLEIENLGLHDRNRDKMSSIYYPLLRQPLTTLVTSACYGGMGKFYCGACTTLDKDA
jgi:hypothetical protein